MQDAAWSQKMRSKVQGGEHSLLPSTGATMDTKETASDTRLQFGTWECPECLARHNMVGENYRDLSGIMFRVW